MTIKKKNIQHSTFLFLLSSIILIFGFFHFRLTPERISMDIEEENNAVEELKIISKKKNRSRKIKKTWEQRI